MAAKTRDNDANELVIATNEQAGSAYAVHQESLQEFNVALADAFGASATYAAVYSLEAQAYEHLVEAVAEPQARADYVTALDATKEAWKDVDASWSAYESIRNATDDRAAVMASLSVYFIKRDAAIRANASRDRRSAHLWAAAEARDAAYAEAAGTAYAAVIEEVGDIENCT